MTEVYRSPGPTLLLVLMACTALWTAGCGPRLSPEDLGDVIFELPEVPGAEEPYRSPEMQRGAVDPARTPGLGPPPLPADRPAGQPVERSGDEPEAERTDEP